MFYPTLYISLAGVLLGYLFWLNPVFQEVAAGLAIFLFGMMSLEQGFRSFTGGMLQKILQHSTNKLWKSLSFGVVSTTLMQSSSLVSLLTISFLSAELIGLASGIGIVFGANLGTTTGAWLVAAFGMKVKISAYAMPLLVFGLLFVLQAHKTFKGIGYVLLGLGFLFLGIHYMKEGFAGFGSQLDLSAYALPGWKGVLAYTGIGIIATVIMQSSHATLVLTITALASGQLTYDNALALAIGSNVGTTITAMLGAIGANSAGKRLALAHLIFNITTGTIAIILLPQLLTLVEWLAPMLNITSPTLKLALFHTLFNLLGITLMTPFLGPLVRLLERTFHSQEKTKRISQPYYLNASALSYPDTALEVLYKESEHLLNNTLLIVAHSLGFQRRDITKDKVFKEELPLHASKFGKARIDERYSRKIKPLYNAIIEFSAQAQTQMTEEQIQEVQQLRLANRLLVDVVKSSKELQNNLREYLTADNSHIQQEYQRIRKQLGLSLHNVVQLGQKTSEERSMERLKNLHQDMEDQDVIANGVLDRLIREQLITDKMATSLMNDSGYAYDINKHLLAAVEIIFELQGDAEALDLSEPDILEKEIVDQQSHNLDEQDLEHFLHEQKAFVKKIEDLLEFKQKQ